MCLLATIPFQRGSKSPLLADREQLPMALRWLRDDARRQLLIRGHSDAGGTDAYNLRLSAARARWVRNWILKRQIPSERVATQAFGEFLPVAGVQPDDAEQRRVELFGIGGPCRPR